MEVGEKTSKRGFAVNRCIKFTLGTRYVPSRSTSEVKVILGCCWLRYLRKRGTWFRDRKKTTYLSHMFKRITRRFLDNTFDPKPSVQTVPKKIIYFCLPFTGIHSLQIRTQINRLCNASSLISILDSFSAPPDESLLLSPLRIKFPSTRDLVLFTSLRAAFQLSVFYTYVHACKSLSSST